MLLEANNLSVYFGKINIIRKLSFEIKDHEILGIIGPNGAGKSTLFNLLTGFLFPTSGDILFKGKKVTHLPPQVRARYGIAKTFQSTKIFHQQSVLDNVIVGLIPRMNQGKSKLFAPGGSLSQEQVRHQGQELIDFVGLENRGDTLAGELDQEEQKRLAIGMAMATNPQLLLLDEPTGGINVEEINRLSDIIRRIWNKGVTICLIEHKMKMIMELCQRIIVLNYGEKIAEGTPQEIRKNKLAIKAYLGEEYAA